MTEVATKGTGDSGTPVGWVGSLGHTPLAEVFRRIALEELSGDLQVTTSSAIKTVYFDRGFVVFASSNQKNDRLGESMIEAGRISRHEFAVASMLMKSTRRKFGQALVQAGIVSEEELGHQVAAHVNRIVLSLFSEKQGMYSFDERPCVIPLELMVSLSVYRILIEGVRRMSSKKLIVAGLPSLDTEMTIVEEPPFTLDVDRLRPVEKAALESARHGASLHEIAETIGGNEGLVLRACYGLYAGGILEAARLDGRRRPRRVQEETGTFVLSEIRRKVGQRREEIEVPAVSPVPPVSPKPERPLEAPVPPFVEPAPELRAGIVRSLLSVMAGLLSEVFRLGQDIVSSLKNVRVSHLASTLMAFFQQAVVDPLSSLARRGRIAEEPEPWLAEEEPPAAAETPPTRSAPSATRAAREDVGMRSAASPEREPTEPEQLVAESPGIPSWSVKDDPNEAIEPDRGPEPFEEARQEPSEPSVESLGVPRWSMKDASNESGAPVSDAYDEPASEGAEPDAVMESQGIPSWSLKDDDGTPSGAREIPSVTSSPRLTVDPPAASAGTGVTAPLSALDSELFVEPEDERDSETSMLNPIPVEEIHLQEDTPEFEEEAPPEFEIEVQVEEETFAGPSEPQEALSRSPDAASRTRAAPRADEMGHPEIAETPAPSETAGSKKVPVSSSPERSAAPSDAPPPRQPHVEEQEISAPVTERGVRAQRVKHGGGEARLLRDVKLHFKVQDWEGAVPLLEQLVHISPGSALYRGMLARAMSRHPLMRNDAEKHFIEALRLSPQDPELHYWLGLYYKSFGLKSRAYNEFRTTLRIDPQHKGARQQVSGGGRRDDAVGAVFKKLFG